MDISGKVFIVTGGASGLGEGTARMLSQAGGKVVIADMQVEKGEAIAQEIGGTFVKCDVSSEADGQAVVAKALSLGKLMGLVNCPADFVQHPHVINGCSELFAEVWGPDHGVGVRSAFGAGSLPLGVAVEIEAVFELA